MNRILLIEDDPGAQLLYRNRLADLGYQVVVSATGARGLMEARSTSFDLFLVDIDLGTGIDGYEVCRRLKTIPEIHGVPVVLISANVKAQEDLHRGYEAGCQSFLVKGDLMLLEDVVRAMLRIKSLQDDLALQNRLLDERNRRFEAEKAHSADLEQQLASGGHWRPPPRPDGMLLCDGDGVVLASDRGARDLLGQAVENKHLALIAPDSRLEACVRDARTEPREWLRFDVPERPGRAARALLASLLPFGARPSPSQPALRLVLLFDAARRRQTEGLRVAEGSLPGPDWAPILEAAREVFRPAALVGDSAPLRALRERLAALARGEGPVLVQGPAGSGKSLVARILHFTSERGGALVGLSCAALGADELEGELFGVARGAGPEDVERAGAFQRASGGTLFLQDPERLGLPLQERLLEALASGRITRQGSKVPERVDVRLVASTRAELARAVERGEFLPALAQRLAAETLVLPPLAQRVEDIAPLARHFLARRSAGEEVRLTPEALAALERHAWPDDVRGLEQTLATALACATSCEIRRADLPSPLSDGDEAPGAVSGPVRTGHARATHGLEGELEQLRATLDSTVSLLDAYEKGAILHALGLTQGDKLAAARVLRIGKSTFYRKLKHHGIR